VTPTVVRAAAWRRLNWRAVPSIPPTSEWWVHHGALGQANLATLRSYERYHVATLGWRAPGYNWAITGDGTVYELRGWLAEGGHTRNRNRISQAVLLVGDWTSGRVPEAMVESLAWLTVEGHRVGALRSPTISGGHGQAPGQATTCPGTGGLDAVARARRLLAAPPVLPKDDVMTPAQEAKLDEALSLLRQRNYSDDTRRIRLSLRAIGRKLGIPTAVNGKADGTEVIT
jgi:hypothetical protein